MALPITTSPVLPIPVAGITSTASNRLNSGNAGPWRFGGALYGLSQLTGGVPSPARVFRSTDEGATWNGQDSASAPTSFFSYTAVADLSAGYIHAIYRSSTTGTLHYVRFDMNTNTWGVTVNSGVAIATSLFVLALRSNGDCVAFYPSGADIQYRTISSQVFSAAATLVAGAVALRTGCIDAATGTCHLIYIQGGFYKHITLTSGGVVGAPANIVATTNIVAASVGNAVIWNDRILFSYSLTTGSDELARFYEGTPVAAPVWTSRDLHQSLPAPNDGWADQWNWVAPWDPADKVYFWWIVRYQPVDPDDAVVRIYAASWDGTTLGEPELFWDSRLVTVGDAGTQPGDEYANTAVSVLAEDGTFHVLCQATPVNLALNSSIVYAAASVCVIEFTPSGDPIVLPAAVAGESYTNDVQLTEGGSERSFDFALDSGQVPPGFQFPSPGTFFRLYGRTALGGFEGPVRYDFTIRATVVEP